MKKVTMTIDMEYYKTWEEYQTKYVHLRQKFLEISSLHINATTLATLKDNYDSVIKSKRASDNIKDLPGLLRILEDRTALSSSRIDLLKEIAIRFVKDPVLNKIIQDYEVQLQNQQTLPLFNVYECRSGEYSEIEQANNSIRRLEESISNEDSLLEHVEPPICLGLSTSEGPLISHSNNQTKSSIVDPTDFHRSANNHFYFFNRNQKSNLKYIIPFLSVTMVLVFISVVLIVITIYVKSLVSDATANTTVTRPNQSQQIGAHSVAFYPTTSSFRLQQTPHWDQTPTSSVSDLQTKVFHRLGENLGRHWRDLARFLDIKESEIDAIDLKTTLELKEKAYEALEIFRSRCELSTWRRKLLRALQIIRRKDLAEMVEELIETTQ